MGDYTVYMHVFPNGKKYVGITGQDVSRRWRDGEGCYGRAVYSAILKYGWDNITHKILFDGLTKEQAEEKEVELIKLYKTTGRENGYNVELGGNAVGEASEESERENSESHKGPMAGERHWDYGKHWGGCAGKKIGEPHEGMRYGKEAPGRKSAIFSGAGNPMYGTGLSPRRREKLQAACVKAKSRPAVCIETGKAYRGAAQARRKTGICPRAIGYVANRDRRYKTAGGYHWEYREVA